MKTKGLSDEAMRKVADALGPEDEMPSRLQQDMAEAEQGDEEIQALAQHLGIDQAEIEFSTWGEYEAEGGEYWVLTDEEADAAVREEIEQSLWTFRAEFIIGHTNLPEEGVEMIQAVQESKYEDASPVIRALITDFDSFVEDAVMSDGRGNFLSSYDGEENEEQVNGTWYYIYRTN